MTFQVTISGILMEKAYEMMIQIAAGIALRRRDVSVTTPMAKFHQDSGVWTGPTIDPSARVSVAAIMGAGLGPAYISHRYLGSLIDPAVGGIVRRDTMSMERRFGLDGKVEGVDASGIKIRGTVRGFTNFITDPIVATVRTLLKAIKVYNEEAQKEVGGPMPRHVSVNLFAAPEGVQRIVREHPETIMVIGRLCRAGSSERALRSPPGTFPDEERGLDDHDYVIDGPGDVGRRDGGGEK